MTTDNLIGYDPLAWMEGEEIGEKPAVPAQEDIAVSEADNTPILDTDALVELVESEEPEPIIETKTKTKTKAKKAVAEAKNGSDVAEMDETLATLPEVIVAEDEPTLDISDTENNEATDDAPSVDVELITENDQSDHGDSDIDDSQTNDDDAVDMSIETQESPSDADTNIIDMIIEEETQIEIDNIDPIIRLNSDATIKGIVDLYQQVKRVLDFHDIIEINAVEVTTVDTATLQLLVSLKKEEKRSNKTINITSPSSRFLESVKLLGLLSVLDLAEG